MKDTVEQFLKDEDFNLLPFLMLQSADKSVDSDKVKSILKYNDIVFWIENNDLHIKKQKNGIETYYVKSLQDIMMFPVDFKAIKFFEEL